jgi:hypothetical protein
MKKFFLTTVVFSVLLIVGCQENSITDPITKQDLQKNDDPLVQQGTIALDDLLVDPSLPFNSYLTISGQIDYVLSIEFLDPIPPAPQYYVSLSLQVNARLSDLNAGLSDPYSETQPYWPIIGSSQDIIYVSGDGIYLLEKSFTVRGREDGLILVSRFLVTTDGVELNSMQLVLPEATMPPGLTISTEVTFPPVLNNNPEN